MKKILTLCILSIFSFNCKQKNSTNMKIEQIPLEKQITYALALTIWTPYELYIDDIKADFDYTGANSGVDLNPYLLKNGKHTIKLKLFPLITNGKIQIRAKDIKNSSILFGTYVRNKKTGEILNFKVDNPLPITVPNTDVPYFEQEWEVEVTELPYELEGWSNGQDLRKWDQKELEKKVVAYYKKLWEILNNGEGEKYMDLWRKADEELVIYNYENNYNSIYISEAEDIKKGCKNMMVPLEDYEMKIYAEGKIVTLERKTHTKEFNHYSPLDIKGWSPLIRKGKKAGGSSYGVKLYLPKDSDEFVIIRK